MKLTIAFFMFSFLNFFGFGQEETSAEQTTNILDTNLPYSTIPDYSDSYNSGNIVKRMVDGLGFRYYWATEGLTTSDLVYKPSAEAQNAQQTLEHMCGLSEMILNAAKNAPNVRPKSWSDFTFIELRKTTLENLKKASELFEDKTAKEIAELEVIFESNAKKTTYPFWNMLNGPIADALYHTGQIVSFRRTSGNPINPKVNVFLGKLRN